MYPPERRRIGQTGWLGSPRSPTCRNASSLGPSFGRWGGASSQIDHEINYGRWHAPARGVVALQNAPLTYDQRLWLGVLHAGDGAVLTHLTSCRRAGLEWKGDDETIHVLTPKGDLVDPIVGFFFHQTRRPYQRWLGQIPSGPPRLPIEYAALLAAERDRFVRRAVGLLAACVQQQLTTADRLLATQPRIRKLRNGAVFAVVLGDIAGGAQSFAEIDVGHLCERAGLAQPVRQAVRTDAEGRRRYLDCEWVLPDGRVVVLEVDGSFHLKVGNWWRDMKRERAVVLSRTAPFSGAPPSSCASNPGRSWPTCVAPAFRRCRSSTERFVCGAQRGITRRAADESRPCGARRSSSSWPRTRAGPAWGRRRR